MDGANNYTGDIYRSGKVGIGTTNPQAILDVGDYISNETLGTVFGRLLEGDTTGEGTYLGVKGYSTQNNLFDGKSFSITHSFYGNPNSTINFYRGNSTTGGFLTFNTNNDIERMRIQGNGNVGIGTLNPSELLSVNGKILCEEVEVVVSVAPDYVFQKYFLGNSNLKPDYVMPTLNEVEDFIKKNHHLPEVPSAQEIIDEGLQLKEMTNLLLQKIEELTLYTLEQEKRIKELESKLEDKQ